MTIWNLGSINADIFYRVPHLPAAGETLTAQSMQKGLGGKGANMSVAISRAGQKAAHIGAVGLDGNWAKLLMTEYGVDTRFIKTSEAATGHAIISVDDDAENSIIIFSGANIEIEKDDVASALSQADVGDFFVTQNETNLQAQAAKLAKDMGLKVAYAAAPFSIDAVKDVIPNTDILFLNEVEAQQLNDGLGKSVTALGIEHVIITLGGKGSVYHNTVENHVIETPAFAVEAVDTTGAGDTFTGYVLAGLDSGMPMNQALEHATKAGAIMVTRMGTADVIPDLKDVRAFS